MSRSIGAILDRNISLNGVTFDVVDGVRVGRSQQIAVHPIEDGSQISDHAATNNIALSFRGEVGNISLDGTATGQRAIDIYETLIDLFDSKALFDFQTGFELFENVLFVSLDQVDESAKSGALLFDATMEQLRIVEAEQVAIPQSILRAGKTRQQLSSKINRGRVEPGEDIPPLQYWP